MLNPNITPHTVYILCGPTMCGKSTFAERLAARSRNLGLSSQIISSDFARINYLAQGSLSHWDELNPLEVMDSMHSSGMLSVSKQAFELLFTHLKAMTSYPINTEVVIVDTTGMDEGFRKDVVAIAKANCYKVELVTFEYKTRAEYLPNGVTRDQEEVVMASVDKFRKRVLPKITVKDFDNRWRIKTRNFDFTLLDDEDHEKLRDYARCFELAETFAVIGDSHECVDVLKGLIEVLESEIPGIQIVHAGDYLDKGGNTAEMLAFMHDRVVDGKDWLVEGNHESYVFKRLKGIVKPDFEMERANFSSLEVLEAEGNVHLQDLFFDIHHKARPFMVVHHTSARTSTPVIITHAPCENKYIGKMSQYAMRAQRNYRVVDRSAPLFKELEWYYKEAESIFPTHVCGHFAHEVTDPYGYRYKNKIFIDTGCVYGYELSAAVFSAGKLVGYRSVDSTKPKVEGIEKNLGMPPKAQKAFDIDDYDLDPGELRLLNQAIKHEIKYISGTMAPAPSKGEEIEPLHAAFDYFKKKGVDKVVVQTKEMGSRCQAYLFYGEPERTMLVSRGGWRIRGIEGLNESQFEEFCWRVYDEYAPKVCSNFCKEVILDGELLPWAALGKGLIDHAFGAYESLVEDEINELCLNDGLADLPDFAEWIGIEKKGEDLNAFKNSLANFTQNTPPRFKAFSILKWGNADMSRITETVKYMMVNDDKVVTVDLNTGDGLDEAEEMFGKLTIIDGKEGVVLKPDKPTKGAPPYMKVRSPEYLRLVYGYDYTSRLDKLCRQKSISGKVAMSIKEYEMAEEMLTAEPDKRKELIVKMIGNLKAEKSLDPRL